MAHIKIGDPAELSADYSLATISSVDEKGKTTKGKVLVATDVSDNYVMLLGSDDSEYKENEKIMDEIWGASLCVAEALAARASLITSTAQPDRSTPRPLFVDGFSTQSPDRRRR